MLPERFGFIKENVIYKEKFHSVQKKAEKSEKSEKSEKIQKNLQLSQN